MTPDQYTIQETMLDVGDGHQLYVQDWGNKQSSAPIIVLHGGPGGQSRDTYKRTYDPSKQRVVFFDQRGCGKSLPYGSLEHNTTADLVADITKIADHLKLDTFILTGGSWGSALAFFYAIAHPERVKAMVLNGIYTGTKLENDWLDKGGFQMFYPEAWDHYVSTAPAEFEHDPSSYHFPRIVGDDPAAIAESGLAYETLEGSVMSLDDRHAPADPATYDPSSIRIEVQYLSNGCFMPDGYILEHAPELPMPIWLVQGRYDMVCPPVTAYNLAQQLPHVNLVWATSGHKAEHESWNLTRTILLQLTAKK